MNFDGRLRPKVSLGLMHLSRTLNGFSCFCGAKGLAKTTNRVSPDHFREDLEQIFRC